MDPSGMSAGTEFHAFIVEMRVRLGAVERQLTQVNALLLERSGDRERFRTLEHRVAAAESAQGTIASKVNRIWLGGAGVLAVFEVLRLLPPGLLDRFFGR